MLDRLEVYDNVMMLLEITERATLLLEEVTQNFLSPLEHAEKDGDVRRLRMIATADVHRARLKSEIVSSLLDELTVKLEELAPAITATKTPDAAKPANDADEEEKTRTERIDEIMNRICTFSGMIENFPDWLERMEHLDFVAMCLAMGCDSYNFTCKEPGKE